MTSRWRTEEKEDPSPTDMWDNKARQTTKGPVSVWESHANTVGCVGLVHVESHMAALGLTQVR